MKSTRVILRSLFIFLVLPNSAFAAVQITEIMYDLEGADSGFEWIEITNTGTGAVDVGAWRLFEGNTNHKLKLVKGSSGVLQAGASAVIADKSENFLSHWPDVQTVFDSAFSLSNTGETLALKNGTEVVDQISYTEEMGAKGDGGSLHRQRDSFVAALPSPGEFGGALRVVPAKQQAVSAKSATQKAEASKKAETNTEPSTVVAAVNEAPKHPLLPWILGLISIIALGIGVAVLAKFEQSTEETSHLSDEFEIVDNLEKTL